jgi:hypothetical protein
MSDEQIRIAIAEACGWTREPSASPNFKFVWKHETDGYNYALPDFPYDLNAMYEAEEHLKGTNWESFCNMNEILASKVLRPDEHIFHATARQRAEAFLKTLNKWKE